MRAQITSRSFSRCNREQESLPQSVSEDNIFMDIDYQKEVKERQNGAIVENQMNNKTAVDDQTD